MPGTGPGIEVNLCARRRDLPELLVFWHRDVGDDVLGRLLVARADQKDVAGVHDDEILQTADGNELVVVGGIDEGVSVALAERRAGEGDVAVRLDPEPGNEAVQRLPVADVVPAEFGGEEPGLVGLLHHRVVYGYLADAGIDALQESCLARSVEDLLPSAEEDGGLRHMLLELFADRAGAPDEDTGIPEELPALEEHLGKGGVGLLRESLDLDGLAFFLGAWDPLV